MTVNTNITATNTSATNVVQNTGSGLLNLSGTLTKNGTTLTLAGGTNGINVSGSIQGADANSDISIEGTVTISNSNNYNGDTLITNGATLIANAPNATGTLGAIDIASGGTLQVGTASNYALTLTTGGFALTNGSIIRVYVGSVDTSLVTPTSRDGYTHYDLSNNAGVTYSTLTTTGTLDVSGFVAGGTKITIEVVSANENGTTGLLTNPFYDFKFLQATTVTLGSNLQIADLFTIDTTGLKYANGNTVTGVSGWGDYSDLIKVYAVQNGNNTVLMMSIPEPSTYGLGLGALALAAVAIRRRKQKQKKETV
jgi:hypothetical protein